LDFELSQLRAVITIMINAIVAVSNPHALANFSKLIRMYHINRLKHDTKSRKKGRRDKRKEGKKKRKKKKKEKRGQ